MNALTAFWTSLTWLSSGVRGLSTFFFWLSLHRQRRDSTDEAGGVAAADVVKSSAHPRVPRRYVASGHGQGPFTANRTRAGRPISNTFSATQGTAPVRPRIGVVGWRAGRLGSKGFEMVAGTAIGRPRLSACVYIVQVVVVLLSWHHRPPPAQLSMPLPTPWAG